MSSTFFGHPRGLATLFFTEMWERFTYYGMRAVLVLFLVAAVSNGGLGIDDKAKVRVLKPGEKRPGETDEKDEDEK